MKMAELLPMKVHPVTLNFFSNFSNWLRCPIVKGNLLKKSKIQSTLIISKSKGLSETLRDIRTSTYQMCRTEENTNRTTKFHK